MNISSAKHAALGVWSILCLLPLALCLFSCTEKDEEGEYDNWRARNQQFIDSIAQVAATNADGTWAIYKAYNIGDDSTLYIGQTNYFIYVKKLEKGTGTTYPMYADSVRIHYSGRLIPTMQHPQGYCFGKSYSTNELNEDTDVPTIFCVNRNLTWFTTALIHMHEGDRWIVYVPYYLGQGDKDYTNGKIPAYSSLIMDVKLAKIYRSKIDKDTSWH